MAAVRVRQHVNPLAHKYQKAIAPPDWTVIYPNLTHPLHLDIGSARGYFLLSIAQMQLDWNFLGLEIREPLVEESNQRRDELGLTNLHYLFCNANNSLLPVLESLPAGILQQVSIQFPDPWFKKRHQKRRVVQPEIVNQLANYLTIDGEVFVQSDVLEVANQICGIFGSHPAFQRTSSDWLPVNPLPVSTERENSTLLRGEPVYRALFKKRSIIC